MDPAVQSVSLLASAEETLDPAVQSVSLLASAEETFDPNVQSVSLLASAENSLDTVPVDFDHSQVSICNVGSIYSNGTL